MRLTSAAALAFALVLSACGNGPGGSTASLAASPAASGGIVSEVASYQLVVDRPGRLIVALLSADNRWLSFGAVQMSFAFLGDGKASPPPGIDVPSASATFLPVPGTHSGDGREPTLTEPADGRGLYGIEPITFPAAGYWRVTSSGRTQEGTPFSADAAFQVLAKATLRLPGDQALASDNAVIGTPDTPPAAIDSRAATEGRIPDPELHQVSIADALRAHEPALVVFATPVYCVSQFCGPITDLVSTLSRRYANRAAFIHVEIYRDFQANELNATVRDWLQTPGGDLREPWVYLIGADGTILDSWDTMVTRGELESALKELPVRK
jgi:hypothetical protein